MFSITSKRRGRVGKIGSMRRLEGRQGCRPTASVTTAAPRQREREKERQHCATKASWTRSPPPIKTIERAAAATWAIGPTGRESVFSRSDGLAQPNLRPLSRRDGNGEWEYRLFTRAETTDVRTSLCELSNRSAAPLSSRRGRRRLSRSREKARSSLQQRGRSRRAHSNPRTCELSGFWAQAHLLPGSHWVPAFVQRLRELGWIEGHNIAIAYRCGRAVTSASWRSLPNLSGLRSM
jgi:hypothetical protein